MNHKEVGSVDSGSVLHDQHGWGSLARLWQWVQLSPEVSRHFLSENRGGRAVWEFQTFATAMFVFWRENRV